MIPSRIVPGIPVIRIGEPEQPVRGPEQLGVALVRRHVQALAGGVHQLVGQQVCQLPDHRLRGVTRTQLGLRPQECLPLDRLRLIAQPPYALLFHLEPIWEDLCFFLLIVAIK